MYINDNIGNFCTNQQKNFGEWRVPYPLCSSPYRVPLIEFPYPIPNLLQA